MIASLGAGYGLKRGLSAFSSLRVSRLCSFFVYAGAEMNRRDAKHAEKAMTE